MKRTIDTNQAPQAIGPYVQGVNLGQFVITSGQIPIDPDTNRIPDTIDEQTRQVLKNIKAVVEEAGLKVHHIVKMTVFVTNLNDLKSVNKVYEAFFRENEAPFPARSCVQVSRLPKDVSIEIEAIAAKS